MWERPAPCDVTFTSRWRQRSERIEPRTYSADASVDVTDARYAEPHQGRGSTGADADVGRVFDLVTIGPFRGTYRMSWREKFVTCLGPGYFGGTTPSIWLRCFARTSSK